jgi:hypothetical protein
MGDGHEIRLGCLKVIALCGFEVAGGRAGKAVGRRLIHSCSTKLRARSWARRFLQ